MATTMNDPMDAAAAAAAAMVDTPSGLGKPRSVKIDPYDEYGSPGLRRFSGMVMEEFQKELLGPKAAQVYREMASNASVVGASLLAIELSLRQVTWRVEAADETPQAQQAADHVQSCMDDMSSSWEDHIAEVCSFLRYGWSWHEVTYKVRRGESNDPRYRSKYDDNLIGWRKMPGRAQETLYRWDFDDDSVRGMFQLPPPFYDVRYMPIEKSLLYRTTAERGNPEGRSLLRTAYFPWYFSKRIMELEGIGIDRDLTGVPVAGVPPEYLLDSADATQKAVLAAVKKMLRDLKLDEGAGIIKPLKYDANNNELFTLELMSAAGSRQHDTSKIIERYDIRMAQALLTDFMMLGHSSVGSRALAEPKLEFFSLALNGFLGMIAGVLNRHGVPRLIKLNGWPTEVCPKILPGEVQARDLNEVVTYITGLSQAGMQLFPDPNLEEWLRDIAKMPKPAMEPEPNEVVPDGAEAAEPGDGASQDDLGDDTSTGDGAGAEGGDQLPPEEQQPGGKAVEHRPTVKPQRPWGGEAGLAASKLAKALSLGQRAELTPRQKQALALLAQVVRGLSR